LPRLQHVLDTPTTVWQSLPVARWHSQAQRPVAVVWGCCVWFP